MTATCPTCRIAEPPFTLCPVGQVLYDTQLRAWQDAIAGFEDGNLTTADLWATYNLCRAAYDAHVGDPWPAVAP
jgi:hypothetical protein